MSNAGRIHLAVNGNGWDKPWFENPQPLIEYRHIVSHENNVTEQVEYTPVSNASTYAYGNTIKFELDRKIDYAGKMEFIITRAADTAGGSVAEFADFEGLSSIDTIRVYSDNIPAMEWKGEFVKRDLLQEAPIHEREVAALYQNGYLLPGERRVKAHVQVTTLTDLRLPFGDLERRIPAHTMSGKIKVDIAMKTLANCCKNSAGSTFILSNPILRIQGTHVSDASRKRVFDMVHGQFGLPIKFRDVEYHVNEQLTANAGIQKIKLVNLKNASFLIKFFIRYNADLTDNTALKTMNFIPCNRYWLEENGSRITPIYHMLDSADGSTIADYSTGIQNHEMFPLGQKGLKVGSIPFIEQKTVGYSDKDCWGSRALSGYNNLELAIQFDNAPGQTLSVDVVSHIHNYNIWHMGQLKKYTA